MRKLCGFLILTGGAVVTLAVTALIAQPVGVSPGRTDAFSRVEARCPTFSWAAVEGAEEYVAMVFELSGELAAVDDRLSARSPEPVLQTSFPGNVYSWTPDLDSCLAPGGRYAWVVQARVDGRMQRSEARFFEVAAALSLDERIEAAIERRFGGNFDVTIAAIDSTEEVSEPGSRSRVGARRAAIATEAIGPAFHVSGDATVKANAYLFDCESTAPAYQDADGDTFGDGSQSLEACVPPLGYVANADDCDDTDDTIVPGTNQACYTGPNGTEGVGVCVAGEETCVDGQFGDCVGQVVPEAEQCNNVDDDCDGQTDENNPGGGGDCNTGNPGICAAGTLVCQGGDLDCVQNEPPGAEICDDDLDNDCDGFADELDPDCAA